MTEKVTFEGNCKVCRHDDTHCVQCPACKLVVCAACLSIKEDTCENCAPEETPCPSCGEGITDEEKDTCSRCKRPACQFCLSDEVYGYGLCAMCQQISMNDAYDYPSYTGWL